MIPYSPTGAVVLIGCGRLGSAMVEGWLSTGTIAPEDLVILARSESAAVEAARGQGARINPALETVGPARAVVLAVKPAAWREAVGPLTERVEAPLVSVMAGVRASDIEATTSARVARVMPTTAVAQARGVAAIWSADADARDVARRLFAAVADVVDLEEEALMDAATAVAGSAPAFIYALTQALARAGETEGLSVEAAARLARGALRSAGAGEATGEGMAALIARIASPGGTTRAGLDVLNENGGLDRRVEAAVEAAVKRARELSV